MKILMLGWEFPPLISGGLATATEGLVSGLTQLGHQVALVLPHFPKCAAQDVEDSNPRLTIVSPEHPFNSERLRRSVEGAQGSATTTLMGSAKTSEELQRAIRLGASTNAAMPGEFLSHYETADIESMHLSQDEKVALRQRLENYRAQLSGADLKGLTQENAWTPLNSAVSEQTEILSMLASDVLRGSDRELFDVIHAHDWMSLKALSSIKVSSTLPIVLHVHSTEYDRAGLHGNQKIQSMEKLGFHMADRLVAVSNLTRRILVDHYGVSPEKIDVVYNASNLAHARTASARPDTDEPLSDKTAEQSSLVSFVGRVTYQKGPAYFVQSAHKALQIQPNLRFQVVGTGDLLPSMRQLAWELGILDKFTFHGFQSAKKVETLLAESDVFVMPSVSEPFGIVALEAMAQRIPIIISKQSGVAECLMHALKVDFWDTELMADRIVSLVRRSRLRQELKTHGTREVERFNWENSARRCIEVYRKSSRRVSRV